MAKRFIIFLCYMSIFLSLSACNHNSLILKKQYNYHIVKPGDTLYSIAKKHHVKLAYLIRANNIKAPHTLYRGQKLVLPNKEPPKRAYAINSHTNTNKHNITKNNHIIKPTCNFNTAKLVKLSNKNWSWPANGKIIKSFIAHGPNKGNGIDIIGKKGDPVMSASDGKVMYSGNNLRGYGNLIIIKHDQDFLSAYAHNEKILVKEQQKVVKGQQIATMGDTEANRVVLHFEVRHQGKPIDPLQVLAKK